MCVCVNGIKTVRIVPSVLHYIGFENENVCQLVKIFALISFFSGIINFTACLDFKCFCRIQHVGLLIDIGVCLRNTSHCLSILGSVVFHD